MRTSTAFALTLAVLCAACRMDSSSTRHAGPSEQGAAANSGGLDAARALLDDGKPREALVELDALHVRRPKDREAWVLRARACIDVAASEAQPQFFYEDALAAIGKAQELEHDAALDVEAARTARLLLRPEAALEFIERAERELGTLSPEQERVRIEIDFDRFLAGLRAGEERTTALGQRLEERLTKRLAADSTDAWALTQLANLLEWQQRDADAAEVLGRLVRATPDDENAHRRFTQRMRASAGSESVAASYDSLVAAGSATPMALWFQANELFELGLAALAERRDACQSFVRAEQQFRACRSARPEYESSCKAFEVMCPAGVGWSLFHAGDDAGAERAFLATADVLEGGIEYQLEGRLASGFTGLEYLADRALRSATGESDYEAAGRAARIGAKLRQFRPQDAEIANNVGYFHRQWGVPMLGHARELRAEAAAAQGAARSELEALATKLENEARSVIAACCDAYKACSELAPENVRWKNSYALMLVYHYPSRADEAERLLQRCVSLGEQQLLDETRSAAERESITEGLGDANQNLGVLELVHRKNPARAREYFQRSFELGPRPRVDRHWVKDVALHWVREAAEGRPVDLVALDPRISLLE